MSAPATGFGRVRRTFGASKKIVLEVIGVIEGDAASRALQVRETGVAEGKEAKEYTLLPKADNDKGWPEDTAVGSILMVSGLDKAGDAHRPKFVEWGSRYPGIDMTVKVEAAGLTVRTREDGEPYAMANLLAPSLAVNVKGADDVAAAVAQALKANFAPCADGNRAMVVRWKDAEGKLQHFFGSQEMPLRVGTTEQNGAYVDNDVDARVAEITEAMAPIVAEELEAGSGDMEFVPYVQMMASTMNALKERGGEARFHTAADQFVTGQGVSERTGKEWKNYGVVEGAYIVVRPTFDVEKLKEAAKAYCEKENLLKAFGGKFQTFLSGFKVGENVNSLGLASWLQGNGVDVDPYKTGLTVGTIIPESYPSPRPMSAIRTPLHAPDWKPAEAGATTGGQAAPGQQQEPDPTSPQHGGPTPDELSAVDSALEGMDGEIPY